MRLPGYWQFLRVVEPTPAAGITPLFAMTTATA